MKSKWKKPKTKSLTKKVATIEAKLRTRKPELKNNTQYHNASISSVGTMYPVSNLAESYTSSTRDGLEVRGLNVQVRLNVRSNILASGHNMLRIIYFVDKQQVSDTYPTGDDLLHNKANAVVSPYSEVHKNRFQILKDITFTLSPLGSSPIQYQKRFTLKLDKTMRYNGSSASDYQRNMVWMYVITDASSTYPEFYVANRFNYYDV